MVAKESSQGASEEGTEAVESKVDAKKVAVKKTVKKKAAPRKSRAKKPPRKGFEYPVAKTVDVVDDFRSTSLR